MKNWPHLTLLGAVVLAAALLPRTGAASGAAMPRRHSLNATPTPTAPATPSPTPPPAPGRPRWHSVITPMIGGATGVAALAPDDVWLVGNGIYHWDGSAWAAIPHPLPPGDAEYWSAISAASADSIWVVGTVIEHWDGHQWTVLPGVPTSAKPRRPAASDVFFGGISAVGPADAYVTFVFYNNGILMTSFIHCTTQSCSQSPIVYGGFDGIAGTNPDDVWTVGADNSDLHATDILHWDGRTWNPVPAPNVGFVGAAVEAIAPDDVWAVGDSFLHWDGRSWQAVPSPTGAVSISASASNDVWTAGFSRSGAADPVQHWDGHTWQLTDAPLSGYRGISALAPDDVWAVGFAAPNTETIVEHYVALAPFADVPAAQPFAAHIAWMAARGYLSGYACGGPGEACDPYARPYFRPGANVTRAQLLKLVALAAGWALTPPPSATFADVPAAHPFYAVVEAGARQGVISGYACGGPDEPCDQQRRPYFRPNAPITRGQVAKVLALARGYAIAPPASPTFADVAASDPFYGTVEAVARAGIVSGYACGGPGEPCDQQQRPYYRPAAAATRGQVSKFVTLAYGGPAR